MTRRENILLLATQGSVPLADKVAAELHVVCTPMVRNEFADGEIYHAFPCDVSGRDIIIIAATHTDAAQQELVDLIAGSRYWNARSVNVVIPYLGYSTMEQARPASGEIPKGITRTTADFSCPSRLCNLCGSALRGRASCPCRRSQDPTYLDGRVCC